jgi:hypothetical protein
MFRRGSTRKVWKNVRFVRSSLHMTGQNVEADRRTLLQNEEFSSDH